MKTKSKTKIKPKKLGIVITNYASGIPFWIKMDIDGDGKRWLLAFLRLSDSGEGRKIVYPMEDFEDFWDAAHYSKYEQRVIEPL